MIFFKLLTGKRICQSKQPMQPILKGKMKLLHYLVTDLHKIRVQARFTGDDICNSTAEIVSDCSHIVIRALEIWQPESTEK